MKGYDASTWGDRFAEFYEKWLETTPVDTEGAVDFLAELAGEGPVLELAVGGGRLALPLADRGLEVHGVEASEAMADKLRQRAGDRIPVTIGDFADVPVEGRYRLIFVAFNTFPALTTQEAQVRCVENVAAHLTDDGVFVVECPVVRDMKDNSIFVWSVEPDRVTLTFERLDAATQTTEQIEAWITEEGVQLFPSVDRYVWPSELDLMARLAGLRLRERWSDWRRAPFSSTSGSHVSVYERDTG